MENNTKQLAQFLYIYKGGWGWGVEGGGAQRPQQRNRFVSCRAGALSGSEVGMHPKADAVPFPFFLLAPPRGFLFSLEAPLSPLPTPGRGGGAGGGTPPGYLTKCGLSQSGLKNPPIPAPFQRIWLLIRPLGFPSTGNRSRMAPEPEKRSRKGPQRRIRFHQIPSERGAGASSAECREPSLIWPDLRRGD